MLDLLGYGAFFLTMALTYAIICLGLNVQWGQTGLFNVGVAGFVAIGAYVSALLTTPDAADRFGGFGLPIVVGWLGGALAAGLATFLVGALTIRLRADYLAIATFGVAVVGAALRAQPRGPDRRPVRHRLHPAPLRRPRPATRSLFSRAQPRRARSSSSCCSTSRWSGWSAAPGAGCCAPIREDEAAALALGKNADRFRLQAFAIGGAHHGPRRRGAGAFHRLHRAGQLPCRC